MDTREPRSSRFLSDGEWSHSCEDGEACLLAHDPDGGPCRAELRDLILRVRVRLRRDIAHLRKLEARLGGDPSGPITAYGVKWSEAQLDDLLAPTEEDVERLVSQLEGLLVYHTAREPLRSEVFNRLCQSFHLGLFKKQRRGVRAFAREFEGDPGEYEKERHARAVALALARLSITKTPKTAPWCGQTRVVEQLEAGRFRLESVNPIEAVETDPFKLKLAFDKFRYRVGNLFRLTDREKRELKRYDEEPTEQAGDKRRTVPIGDRGRAARQTEEDSEVQDLLRLIWPDLTPDQRELLDVAYRVTDESGWPNQAEIARRRVQPRETVRDELKRLKEKVRSRLSNLG